MIRKPRYPPNWSNKKWLLSAGSILSDQHSPQRRLAYQLPSASATLGYDLGERRLDEDTPLDTHEFDKYLKYQPELEHSHNHLATSNHHQLDSNHNYQQQVSSSRDTFGLHWSKKNGYFSKVKVSEKSFWFILIKEIVKTPKRLFVVKNYYYWT